MYMLIAVSAVYLNIVIGRLWLYCGVISAHRAADCLDHDTHKFSFNGQIKVK